MSLRQGTRILLTLLGAMSIVLTTSSVTAASAASPKASRAQSDPPPFTVTGPIVPTASPQAYQATTLDAQFFSDTQTLPYLSNITYYIASGAFQVSPQSGMQIAGVELAISQAAKPQLLAIGIATPTLIAHYTQSGTQMQSATNSTAPQDPPSIGGSEVLPIVKTTMCRNISGPSD